MDGQPPESRSAEGTHAPHEGPSPAAASRSGCATSFGGSAAMGGGRARSPGVKSQDLWDPAGVEAFNRGISKMRDNYRLCVR